MTTTTQTKPLHLMHCDDDTEPEALDVPIPFYLTDSEPTPLFAADAVQVSP